MYALSRSGYCNGVVQTAARNAPSRWFVISTFGNAPRLSTAYGEGARRRERKPVDMDDISPHLVSKRCLALGVGCLYSQDC